MKQSIEDNERYIEEKINFYLEEIYDFCERENLSRTGTHYWHIASNRVTCIQGCLAKFKKERNLEELSSAEQHIKELETYLDLLERFSEYLEGEFQSHGAEGNCAFPDFTDLRDTDYIYKSKQRLESRNAK